MFKRTIQRYGRTPEPVTRYQGEGQLWDERIGAPRVQAKNWRLMAFGNLAVCGVLAGGMIWLSLQSRVVPYVVEVNRSGEVGAVGPAIRRYDPSDAEIAYYLGKFIEHIRSLSTDPVVVVDHWKLADGFATDHVQAFLNDYAQQIHFDKLVGHRSVSVEIESIVRASDTSFEVKWTEKPFEDGAAAKTEHWVAILSYVVEPPSDQASLNVNPLGIYINAINWSRELSPNETP